VANCYVAKCYVASCVVASCYVANCMGIDISTDQSSYVSIFQQTKAPTCRYFNRPEVLCVDIPTDLNSYVLIFLQRLPVISTTKAPMLRYFNFLFGFVGISNIGALGCRNNGT
jgi:hypothetical protein